MSDEKRGEQEFPCGATYTCNVRSFRHRQDEMHRLTVLTFDPKEPSYSPPLLDGKPAPCAQCPTPTHRTQASTYTEGVGFADDGAVTCSGKLRGEADLAPPPRVVIYHAECADGIVAAWAAWKAWGYSASYIPLRRGDAAPITLCEDADVAIVDLSFSRGEVESIRAAARRMVLLDHHETAERELRGVSGCTVDVSRSGARLAWDHFHPGVERPWLVDYAEDADLHRYKLDGSRAANAWIAAQPLTIDAMEALHDEGFEAAHEAGVPCLLVVDRYVAAVRREAHAARLAGFIVPIVNAPRMFGSEVTNVLAEGGWPFAASWYVRSDGRVKYSLRSSRDEGAQNVARIAEMFPGGGGHPHAASFVVDKIVHETVGGPEAAARPDVRVGRLYDRSGRPAPCQPHGRRVVTLDGAPKPVMVVSKRAGAVHSGAEGVEAREAVNATAPAAPPWTPMPSKGK